MTKKHKGYQTKAKAKDRAKAFASAPPPPQSQLATAEDATTPPLPDMPVVGVDPIKAFDEVKHNFFCRRDMIMRFHLANEDATTIIDSIVGVLVGYELDVESTKPKRQRTRVDRDDAKDILKMVNMALGRWGAYTSFVHHMVEGHFACESGAFLPIVWDRNMMPLEFGVVDPLSVRPFYKSGEQTIWDWNGNEIEGRIVRPAGVYFCGPNGYYQALPPGGYYQSVYNSPARGAWVTGESISARNKDVLTFGSLLTQLLRNAILGCDFSQVLVMNNVDVFGEEGVVKQVAKIKEARRRKTVSLDDLGMTLMLMQLNPDIKAEIQRVLLRGLPDGVDFLQIMEMYALKMGNGYGVKSSRVSTLAPKLRYANSGVQSAQQEGDEWGFDVATRALLDFLNFLIGNRPFKFVIRGMDDPRNYARAGYINLMTQAAAQAKSIYEDDTAPLKRMLDKYGVIPMDDEDEAELPAAKAKASTDDPEKLDESVSLCAQNLQSLWLNFVARDVPALFGDGVLTDQELNQELQSIATLITAQVILCIDKAAGGVRDDYIRKMERAARAGVFNLIGPPPWTATLRPQNPAYNIIKEYATLIRLKRATVEDLQLKLRILRQYVDDYANLAKSANWYALGLGHDGPVDWVRTVAESCPDCIAFEGSYASMKDLLARTNGRLPGNPNLQDLGHCKCYLNFR